ncbi:MAG: TetR/AcrR family transcriptional regulator [Actinocrinis sp.]
MDNSPLPIGPPRTERADAARNREHLLNVAREMICENGVRRVTMDALAERAQLGKGTVFRRFGSRAGIFAALLDDADRKFQQQVLWGPPPLGPGANTIARLIAYGRARMGFLFEHHAIERAAIDRNQEVAIAAGGMSTTHIRMLLGQARREGLLRNADIDSLAMQLAAALEGPLVMYLAPAEDTTPESARYEAALADSWESLIERVFTAP